jgi:hypothetical protein
MAVHSLPKKEVLMQQDIILRIPKCNALQIQACEDPLSNHKEMKLDGKSIIKTERHLCELAVPGACPRVKCHKKDVGFESCRMIALIQSQENESGFWMKLPCSSCDETRQLHPMTEAFVYGEDTQTD